MPSYPAELPSPQISGYSEGTANLVIRSQMDQGPAKTRKRFTAGVKPVTMQTPPYTLEQVDIFDEWFRDEIASGASTFTMKNPRTNTTETFRFVNNPSYPASGDKLFIIRMELEQMP